MMPRAIRPLVRTGGAVLRISISYFCGLGGLMERLAGLKPGARLGDAWPQIMQTQNQLEQLLSTEWFSPAMRSAFVPGAELVNALKKVSERTDLDTTLSATEVWQIASALRDFSTVLTTELRIADAYFVTRKAGYDTTTLIAAAERMFPAELMYKVPGAIVDIREAGKCLAFELSTAAGFHVLRATESVLRCYWDVVTKGRPHPPQRNLGVYLQQLEQQEAGSEKVRAVLKQIKDLHRNPLIHPEEILQLEDAVALFGICISAVAGMLKEIPMPPTAAMSLATSSP